MPVSVEKSPLIEFDSNMKKALTAVEARLNEQAEHVKSVKLLANFSIDKLASLKHKQTILQGMVVQVSPEYQLGPKDMSWFHPDIAAGRSVFTVNQFIPKSKFAAIELDGIQSSVGSYTTSRPDEFGCETVQHHIVVDTTVSDMLGSLYKKWIQTGLSAGDVAKQWKRMQFNGSYGIKDCTSEIRKKIAHEIHSGAEEVYEDTVRDVLSDSSSIYFTNNAVKSDDARVLIKSSSLGGYRMYSATNEAIRFYPASLGTASTYYSFDNLSSKNCARIDKSCAWSGGLEFNAMVMSGPSITGSKIRSLEDAYEISMKDSLAMNTAAFSGSDELHDLLSATDLYNLHPKEGASKSYITAPASMEHPVLQHIMANFDSIQKQFPNFQIFNPKIVENGRLKVPKQLFKQIE